MARTVEQMVKRLRQIENMTRLRPKHAREAYELREALRSKGINPRVAVKPSRVRRKADGTRKVIPSFQTARATL